MVRRRGEPVLGQPQAASPGEHPDEPGLVVSQVVLEIFGPLAERLQVSARPEQWQGQPRPGDVLQGSAPELLRGP